MTWKTGDADEFLEDIMTEHACKFYVAYPVGGRDYRCKCGRAATPQEIVAKLNATERLSAEDARDLAHEIKRHDYASLAKTWRYKGSEALHDAAVAYADILEGKDETQKT